MKKMLCVLVLGIFLGSCSGLPGINVPQFLATATVPLLPTDTQTPAPTKTPIPTQNLFATSTATPLTFTPTVTSIGAELFTPTSTATEWPTPVTPVTAAGIFGEDYFTPQDTGFLTIRYSGQLLYWNEGPCMPRNVMISAMVEDLINTHKVLLFMRLREKKNTLNVTDWGAGIMNKENNGSFNYNIRSFNLDDYWRFKDAWIEYQLVAYDEDMKEIGRTKIYSQNITLMRCKPVP